MSWTCRKDPLKYDYIALNLSLLPVCQIWRFKHSQEISSTYLFSRYSNVLYQKSKFRDFLGVSSFLGFQNEVSLFFGTISFLFVFCFGVAFTWVSSSKMGFWTLLSSISLLLKSLRVCGSGSIKSVLVGASLAFYIFRGLAECLPVWSCSILVAIEMSCSWFFLGSYYSEILLSRLP